eukprot:TRINITY_DN2786_c0_g2_i1.p1 TRINITY_DN2786_c0_g2~~TRINITY_DN2786_c0_g2_i1.p1  ORF type:complete len:145 (+),score=39.55 TRINITY_DN2786_c0_g2_i1:42-437(+)
MGNILNAFPDAKSRLLAIGCIIAIILGIIGSIANSIISFGFWINIAQIAVGLAGLFGAWRRHMFSLFIAMIGFAVLCILNIINGIICIANNPPAVFAAIISFISAAMWAFITFLTWLVRGKQLGPNATAPV